MTQDADDARPALLTRAQSGPDLSTPPLATSCYFTYRRGWGTAVRITRSAPRGIGLPDSRFTDYASWPSVRILQPGYDYFRKGLPPAQFRARYLQTLDGFGPEAVAAALRSVPVEDGRLVLLCFEPSGPVIDDPDICHRRIFADWWEGKTGIAVPELTAVPTTP